MPFRKFVTAFEAAPRIGRRSLLKKLVRTPGKASLTALGGGKPQLELDHGSEVSALDDF